MGEGEGEGMTPQGGPLFLTLSHQRREENRNPFPHNAQTVVE